MAEVDEALKMDFLVSLTNDAILPPNHKKKLILRPICPFLKVRTVCTKIVIVFVDSRGIAE